MSKKEMSEENQPHKKRNALGRGLGALLEGSGKRDEEVTPRPSSSIGDIELRKIEVNPYQPRTDFDQDALQELAESIKVQGIIQPITVRRLGKDNYQLISGERRLQASKLAGLTSIPAFIRTANDQQMLEMALIENIQREDLNAMEVALSYQRLISECELKQEELGGRVGKNRTTVNNYLRLLKLPPDIQIGLRDKKISMGHARALINVESIDKQLEIYRLTVADDLSVRRVEELVRNIGNKPVDNKPKEKSAMPLEYKEVQQHLSSHFGTKVNLKASEKNKGEIKIPFDSVDELNRILELINY